MPKIAVILSGCGVYDGAEIHESVLTLLALERGGAEIVCAAPDRNQLHVIDHARGEPADEVRNIAVEAARIARGPVTPLAELVVAELDGIVFPGGFGAAKNLCDYAIEGPGMAVSPDVARVVREALDQGKPLAFLCIAPVIAARLIPGVRVTIGTDPTTADHVRQMGADHVECPVDGFVEDGRHKVFSTPAYMLGPSVKYVAAGIEKLIARFVQACG